MEALIPYVIQCPYCGESIEILIDTSVPQQRYIEDCQVCCRPINLHVNLAADCMPLVTASSEDDTT